jgi:hypothetical protein
VTPGEEDDQEVPMTMPIGDLPGDFVSDADQKLMVKCMAIIYIKLTDLIWMEASRMMLCGKSTGTS